MFFQKNNTILNVVGEAAHRRICSKGQLLITIFVFLSTLITQSLFTPNKRRVKRRSFADWRSLTKKNVTP